MAGYGARAQFYDIEYVETRDHSFLSNRINSPHALILVIPGGTGTTALALQKAHTDSVIYSVDIEPAMVHIAKARFAATSLSSPQAAEGDMTKLALGAKFDHIFVAREAFQMLPDDSSALACLRCLKEHLSSNGEIVIDVANFDVPPELSDLAYYDGSRLNGQFYYEWHRPISGELLLERRVKQTTRQDGFRHFEYTYEIQKPDGKIESSFSSTLELRKYTLAQLEGLFKQVGLNVRCSLGGYDYSPIELKAPRLCFVLAR